MKNFIFSVNNATNPAAVQYEPNAAVIIRSRYNSDGTVTNNVLTVCNLQRYDSVSIVKHLLRCFIAEANDKADFSEDFGTYENDKSERKATGIRYRQLFGAYLQGDTIYRTDETGKLIPVLTITDGKLSQTALNVTASQAITAEAYNSKAFRALLHTTAKAVVNQCETLKRVDNEITNIDEARKEASDTPTEETPADEAPTEETDPANVLDIAA